jgi:uncharacterized membrane protein
MAARRRERGSISVMAAAGLVTAILAAALAVDLGRVVWSRRELQAVADLAALDAVRSFGECVAEAGDPVEAAAASARRNGFAGDLAALPNRVQPGFVRSVEGVREFEAVASLADAHAVRVEAVRETPLATVARAFVRSEISMRAIAIARQRAAAALRAGAGPGAIDTAGAELVDGLLGALLGTPLDLSAHDYEALVGAAVPLGALFEGDPVIQRPTALLEAETSFAEFLDRLAGALDRRGDAAAAPVRALASAASPEGADFVLGDLISLEPGIEDEAREASLSVFDLVMWGAMVANGSRTITVDPLPTGSPDVARARLVARISEPPRIAIGPPGVDETGRSRTEVRSPRLRGEIELEAAAGVPLLDGAVPRVQLFFDVSPAVARLASIRCARLDDPVHRVTVAADPGEARIGVGHYESLDDPPAASTIVSLSRPDGETIVVRAHAEVAIDEMEHTIVLDGPFPPQIAEPAAANTRGVGTALDEAVSSALRSVAQTASLTVVGPLPADVPREELILQVADLLGGVLDAAEPLVAPLFGALGAPIGGQDVTVSMAKARPPELVR